MNSSKSDHSSDFLMEYDRALKSIPLILSVFVFLGLVITSFFLPSGLGPTPHNWFADYAEALSQGRLYLREGSQWRDCKWDESFFEGKCYLYFGIIPALFHWGLPFVSNRIFSILGASIFTYFFAKVVLKLCGLKRNDNLDWFITSLLILASIGASSFLSLALSSRVYEETICFSHAFGMAGVFFGLPFLGIEKNEASTTNLCLASLFFSLAALTRFSWFTIFALFCVVVLWGKSGGLSGLISWASVSLPLMAFGFSATFQLWLNWYRFNNPLEMGMSFQSTAFRFQEFLQRIGVLSPIKLAKIFASYYFIRFFPEGGIIINKTNGYLQEMFLKDSIILFESPHTLSLALPVVFLPFFEFRRWLFFLKGIWKPILLMTPFLGAVLTIPSIIHRYQFEVSAPLLLASIPYLISRSSQISSRSFVIVSLSCLIGLGFSTYFTFEVVNRFWRVM